MMIYRFLKRSKCTIFSPQICFYKKISLSSLDCMKVLFFGTDDFSLGTLNALHEIMLQQGTITHLDVIPSGKRRYDKKQNIIYVPPVIKYAEARRLNILSWEKVRKEGKFETSYDLGVIASFGDFIPGKLLSLIRKGAINIHPSLLPRWRGPAPVIHTILAGDVSTGVSVIEASKKKFDVGKILYQKEFQVPHLSTSDDLLKYLSEKSGQIMPFIIDNIDDLQNNAKYQCEDSATYAPKVSKTSGYIYFEKYSVSYVERLQRALPSKIGIRTCWDGKEVKLGKIEHVCVNSSNELPVGSCWYDKEKKLVSIKLFDGYISVATLRFEFKKEISAVSFYNGYIIDKTTGRPGGGTFQNINC